ALTNRGIGAFAAATPPVSSRMSPVTRVIALTVPLLSERETGGRDTRTRVISRGPPRGQRGRVDGRGARGSAREGSRKARRADGPGGAPRAPPRPPRSAGPATGAAPPHSGGLHPVAPRWPPRPRRAVRRRPPPRSCRRRGPHRARGPRSGHRP